MNKLIVLLVSGVCLTVGQGYAGATTYRKEIQLSSCRTIPNSYGEDSVLIGTNGDGVYLAAGIPSTVKLVCDLQLPPSATELDKVGVEYTRPSAAGATLTLDTYLTYVYNYLGSLHHEVSDLATCTAGTTGSGLISYCESVVSQSLVDGTFEYSYSAYATIALSATDITVTGTVGYRVYAVYEAP